MAKRTATRDLNHDNWDREEEPEEAGTFHKADDEIMQTRVIRTAKRRIQGGVAGENSGEAKNPFSGLSFTSGTPKTTGTNPGNLAFLNQPLVLDNRHHDHLFFPGRRPDNPPKIPASTWNYKSTPTAVNLGSGIKPPENVWEKFTKSAGEAKDESQTNLETLKDLNLSCSKWIIEHLNSNPYCILTPIFKDYEKHLAKLNIDKESGEGKNETKTKTLQPPAPSLTGLNQSTDAPKPFLLGSLPKTSVLESAKKNGSNEAKVEAPKTFSFGAPPKATPTEKSGVQPPPSGFGGFQFQPSGGLASTFSTPSTGFTFSNLATKPPTVIEGQSNQAEAAEEPPKNEFVPVVESDSIFDIRCKVFAKKDGDFVSRGVGTLFLKPVQGNKTQLVVRADTNIGNILLNILLNSSLPIQKMGNNNVMIVCQPTPDSKPPPIPLLLRVKTTADRDRLLAKLEECSKQ